MGLTTRHGMNNLIQQYYGMAMQVCRVGDGFDYTTWNNLIQQYYGMAMQVCRVGDGFDY